MMEKSTFETIGGSLKEYYALKDMIIIII